MRAFLLGGLAVIAAAMPRIAHATVYDFTFAGNGVSASGAFTTNGATTNSGTLITGISGTLDGMAITSLLAPGTYPTGIGSNDDLLFSAPKLLDSSGFSFVSGGTDYNLYASTGNFFEFTGGSSTELTSFTVTTPSNVPEPASFGMLALGVMMLGSVVAVRRRG